jgi:hypothetical protein
MGQIGLFLLLCLLVWLIFAFVKYERSMTTPKEPQRRQWLERALEIAERAEALLVTQEAGALADGHMGRYTPEQIKRMVGHMRAYLTEYHIRLTVTPELVLVLLAEEASRNQGVKEEPHAVSEPPYATPRHHRPAS